MVKADNTLPESMVPLRESGFLDRFLGTLRNGANSTTAGYSQPWPSTRKNTHISINHRQGYRTKHASQPVINSYAEANIRFNQSQRSSQSQLIA